MHKISVKILSILIIFFMIENPVISKAIENEDFDITYVSSISEEELKNVCPEWCKEYCDEIIYLSNEYGISAEFAISVFRYEYVPKRKSVGGWKKLGNKYIYYDSISESINKWFENMKNTYCNEESWHYAQTNGTTIKNIAPMYSMGKTKYDSVSKKWKDIIESEMEYIYLREVA